MKTASGSSRSDSSRAPAKPQAILLLGMHRSGTSACTRVLNLLGCALPAALIGAGDGNELGHWESSAAVTLNDDILASAGSSWEDWGPINQDWRESALRDVMVGRAVALVEEHAALGPLFALKDPRICRLADLWLEAMDAADIDSRVILMLRNPAEVAESLENRDLMAPGYGQLLWLRHVLDAEYFSRGSRRIVCRYDQLMNNWYGVIDRIKTGLGVALPRNAPAVHAEIEKFLSGEHRHSALSPDKVLANPSLSVWLRRTYAIMLAWSEQAEDAADHAELDAIRDEFDRAYAAFARLLLPTEAVGKVGSGSQLKRELAAQIAGAQQATDVARVVSEETEGLRVTTAAREAELAAQIDAGAAQAEKLQAEISRLAAESQRLGDVAGLEQQRFLEVEQRLIASTDDLHVQQLRNAELVGRAGGAESALVQRQEELAQLWAQLLAAEKASALSEVAIEQERGQRLASENRVAAAEQALALRADEIGQLSASLEQHEAATQAADAARTSSENKLAMRFDEIARMTTMLADEGARSRVAEGNTDWLRQMTQTAAGFPKWWALMPQDWRRQREHARYRRAGLFDAAKYLETYPDVTEHGMDPVRHYILHGMAEGRQRPQWC